MKLIVITSETAVPNELQLITSMFEEGLEILQVHKPSFTKEETEKFIQQIPAKYQKTGCPAFFHSKISFTGGTGSIQGKI